MGAATLVMLIRTMMMMFWFGVVTSGDFIFSTAAFPSPHRKQFCIQLRLLAAFVGELLRPLSISPPLLHFLLHRFRGCCRIIIVVIVLLGSWQLLPLVIGNCVVVVVVIQPQQ